MLPRTRFANSDGVKIAYQAFGDGDVDLVFVPGVVSHVDLMWGDAAYTRFMRRLARFSRVVTFDRRGIGMSERVDRPVTLEERVADLTAVLDAAAVRSAVLIGFSDGGLESILFAAGHATRTRGLILCCSAPSAQADDEQPGFVRPEMRSRMEYLLEHWGDGWNYAMYAPTLAGGAMQRRLLGVFERSAARKEDLLGQFRGVENASVKHVLPAVKVPTLVLHRTDDFVPVASGRFLAKRIPDARFVLIEGADHVPFAGNANTFITHIEDFVTSLGARGMPVDRHFRVIVATRPTSEDVRLPALKHALESAAARCGGAVVGFHLENQMMLFPGADSAVASVEALRGRYPELATGIHAGEVFIEPQGSVGAELHLAARIAARASAGQTLISDAVVGLLRNDFHRTNPFDTFEMKGFGQRHVFELVPSRVSPANVDRWRPRWADRFAGAMIRTAPWQSRMGLRLTGLGRAARIPVP